MSNLTRTYLLLAVTTTAVGCHQPAPAAPNGVGVSPTVVAMRIDTEATVIGTVSAVRAVVTLSSGLELEASDGVVWTSSNDRVARIDAHGVLTALGEGGVVVSAAVKGALGTRSIDVVASVAGTWTLSWTGTVCDGGCHVGCCGGRPLPEVGQVIITQSGSRVDGTWTALGWIQGYPPFAGRIATGGSLDLEGFRCSLDDVGRGTRYFLHDWHMDRAADGTYAGRLTWEQASGCEGEPQYRILQDLSVTGFRRSVQDAAAASTPSR